MQPATGILDNWMGVFTLAQKCLQLCLTFFALILPSLPRHLTQPFDKISQLRFALFELCVHHLDAVDIDF